MTNYQVRANFIRQVADDILRGIFKNIELLREYRTAVISAAVTGKIDVREAMPSR